MLRICADVGLRACCRYLTWRCCLGAVLVSRAQKHVLKCPLLSMRISLVHLGHPSYPLTMLKHSWSGVMQRDPNEWAWEPLALIAYLLFFRILVYIALRKRTKASVR